MKRTIKTDKLKLMWFLGFDSGRIYGNKPATPAEQLAMMEKDKARHAAAWVAKPRVRKAAKK